MLISVVSPVYKAPKILPDLVMRLERSLSQITDSFEVILVDDGCPWNSWSVIEDLHKQYSFIKGIQLSRNFGQHYAITAGLENATGEWIVVMDCDLQDKPEDIYQLYITAQSRGLDMVIAASEIRNLSFYKEIGSTIYRKVFNYFSNVDLENGIGNFGIYHKRVMAAVLSMGDQIRVFPILVKWVGFERGLLMLTRDERMEGISSYSLWSLIRLAGDIGLAFSDKILKIGLTLGVFLVTMALTYTVYIAFRYFNGNVSVPGYTSLLITVLMMSGFILSFLGILGLYISKMFQKVKDRPVYIISNTI